MGDSAGLIAPQQARSRASLTRIFDAVEELLERKEFEEIAVAEIAAQAGVSVGNFYARFKSKGALHALHERYEADRTACLSAAFARAGEGGANLAQRISTAVWAIVGLFRERRGVLRSLILRHWRDPASVEGRIRDRHESLFAQLTAVLLDARSEIAHPRPERAVRVGLTTMLAACRETIVLRPSSMPSSLAIADGDLAQELINMMRAYLTAPPPGANDH